ncbi:MAG: sterol desaturase family protein [Chitinophaga sp.]|uniref:sterol desaturase family protein n=1 Tax=Chitinophaga sp. TaxID=1869181 RepID=UPI0025BAE0BD|nr:sterol desaturase family protein [Chitinophaga sp.]MBV8254790.1 sterol desaturase family protein [Chitinophaga sp.]
MVSFFEHIPTPYRLAIMLGALLLLWVLEGIIPRFSFKGNKVRHAGTNLFFTLTTVVLNTIFAFAILKASIWTGEHHFGLLYLVSLPLWLHALLAVMLLDLIGAYLVHLIQHKTAWMWQFHKIHHIDKEIDATTALRHHPVENLFRIAALLLGVLVAGVPFWMVMLYQTVSVFMSQFTHANIKIPAWIDDTMSWVLVSPDMHKVHHSTFQPETDSNYANIFSLWDRIFGTFVKVKDTTALHYGLDEYQESRYDQVGPLLEVPWEKQQQSSPQL